MQNLKRSYETKCSELLCPPIGPVLTELDANIAVGRPTKALHLSGSVKELFTSRITYPQLAALCEVLIGDTCVEYLDLSYNNAAPHGSAAAADAGNKCAALIARLLRRSRAQRVILLEGNAIGPEGAAELASALADGPGAAPGLEVLNLAANPIGDQGAEALAEMLRTNTSLRMLDVGGCHIGVKGVLALTAALTDHNRSLETLGLDDCLLHAPPQDSTPRQIARMLAINPALKQIYLSKHGIRDFDLQVLVDNGLTKNRSMEVLDLRANRLSPMSATHLARLLHESTSIKVLDLSHNRISDDGAVALAEALPCNRTLQELDLQSCSISDSGLVLLAQALALNTTVVRVMLWGNGFGVNAAAAWRDLLLKALEGGRLLTTDIEPFEADGVLMVARTDAAG